MANDYKKIPLSGSTNGKPILIVATATAGTTIHTATADNTGNVYDEIWIWFQNTSASAVVVTVEYGSATVPDGNVIVTVPSKAGELLVIPGLILNNATTVKAFAGTTNVCTAAGYANQITHS